MTPDAPSVSFSDLVVRYGPVLALDGFSLEIPSRGVFGLLGRNGAGKTTAIRAIVGLVEPESGDVTVLGSDPSSRDRCGRPISVLFAEDGLVPFLTVTENLRVWGGLHGVPESGARSLAGAVLERLDVLELAEQRVGDLSTGNRRLAGLARTFMLPSEMVILDEPTSSLDPVRAEEIRGAVEVLSESRLVLLSTHNLQEAERLCDRLAIMDGGRVLLTGRTDELEEASSGLYAVRTGSGSLVHRGEELEPMPDGSFRLSRPGEPAELLRELLAEGNDVVEFRPWRRELSSVFLELTGGGRG